MALNVAGAVPVSPAQPNVAQLAPIAAAGVDLAKFVLKILAIAIPVWVAIVFLADLATTYTVHKAYRAAINAVASSDSDSRASTRRKEGLQKALASIEKVAQAAAAAAASKGKGGGVVPSGELENAITNVRDAQNDANEPRQNVEKLKAIVVVLEAIQKTPGDVGKMEGKLKESLETLRVVMDNAPSAGDSADKVRSHVELLKELAAERKGVRDSWIQIGQMVLLNLLLPILTALLGYIFGSSK